jgi:Glycosyltransferase Family 4
VRIAYACRVAAYQTDGVNNKISMQVAHWRRAGHDVHLLCLSPRADAAGAEPAVPGTVFAYGGVVELARATVALAAATRRLAPDVVYLRYDLFVPPLPPLLTPLPVVVEINTDNRREARVEGRVGWAYNELSRKATLRPTTGLVCVTHELARSDDLTRYAKPTAVIGNGADPALTAAVPPANGTRPAAVMLLGYPAAWAGVDKVVALAEAMPELDLHLVGSRDHVPRGPLPANVHVHGRLPRDGYREVLGGADFGIGPLALHRIGMSEASPLKVREYLLHGLPVLTAHEDTDFLGEEPWFLRRLPNREDNVATGVPAIRAWAKSVAGRRVPRGDVVSRLGMEGKEAARLAFLSDLVHNSSGVTAAPPTS